MAFGEVKTCSHVSKLTPHTIDAGIKIIQLSSMISMVVYVVYHSNHTVAQVCQLAFSIEVSKLWVQYDALWSVQLITHEITKKKHFQYI